MSKCTGPLLMVHGQQLQQYKPICNISVLYQHKQGSTIGELTIGRLSAYLGKRR